MNPQYLVELRIGTAQWRVHHTTRKLASVYGIEEFMERSPHLTLYGPFTLGKNASVHTIHNAIGSVASAFDWIPFRIRGWEIRQGLNGWVLAYHVDPSVSLMDLRRNLACRLSPMTETENAWDRDPSKAWFHITAANRLPAQSAQAIWQDLVGYSGSKEECPCGEDCDPHCTSNPATESLHKTPFIEQDALRIALVEGETILAEYDLLGKTWLARETAHLPGVWQNTLRQFRKRSGLELTSSASSSGEAYLLSDTHFGHANIIRYCARPFVLTDVCEMDAVLIRNWNAIVGPGDTVYFLGDLRYGADAAPAEHYIQALNGKIVFIEGNHDADVEGTIKNLGIQQNRERFLLIHDPFEAPQDFDGWIIHGHMHNNDLEDYPLIHFGRRTINVSVEVTGYKPIALSTICRLVAGEGGFENIPSLQSLQRGLR